MSLSGRHDVQLHLDAKRGGWWAHCDECHWYAAADSVGDVQKLAREMHVDQPRWDLCIDNRPPSNGASTAEVHIDWAVIP